MSEGVWIAVANGSFSLIGVIATVWIANNRTIYRIDELEEKVNKHNRLIERMYSVERRLDVDEEKIRVANERICDLEKEG